jgi:5'-3' exoribonuclease 2
MRKSFGLAGSIQAIQEYLPGSSYASPLLSVSQYDIEDNRSISAIYLYPKQTIPHRSRLLPNIKLPPRMLNSADYEHVQRGGRGRGGDNGRRGEDTRRPYRNQDNRGYVHNYSYQQSYHGSTGFGNNGWRSNGNSRGQPDYSHGGHQFNVYRGPPPRGVGRGRG